MSNSITKHFEYTANCADCTAHGSHEIPIDEDVGWVVTNLGAITGALGCEPDIRPDLSRLSHAKLPIVLLALMNRGVTDIEDLCDYLDDHGAPFDVGEVAKVLVEFQTTAHRADGSLNGLWRCRTDGSLAPNVAVI